MVIRKKKVRKLRIKSLETSRIRVLEKLLGIQILQKKKVIQQRRGILDRGEPERASFFKDNK